MPSKNPRRWIDFRLEPFPTGATTSYRWSTRPLGTTPFVEGRVQVDGWGDIVNRASSLGGEMNVDSVTVNLRDNDGRIHALLHGVTTKWFKNRQAALYVLSEDAMNLGLDPRIEFAGICKDVQPARPYGVSMAFEDLLSPYLDRLYPQYNIGHAYPWRFTDEAQEIDEELLNTNPGLRVPEDFRDRPLPIWYGKFIDPSNTNGMIPALFMGYTYLSAGTPGDVYPAPEVAIHLDRNYEDPTVGGWGGWAEFLIGLGEYDIPNVYGSNSAAENPHRVNLSEHFGTAVLAPGHAFWPFATDYVIRNGFRCTVIYVRSLPQWHHLLGLVSLTVDVCGWKNNDGVAITQAGPIWQDFLVQHVLSNDGRGYTEGPSVTVPSYANGVPMIWTSKVQEFQDVTKRRLGNMVGYENSVPLDRKKPLRTILQDWHITNFAMSAKDGAGRHYPITINETASEADGVRVREAIEIADLPAPRIGWTDIRNYADFTYGWDPVRQAPRTIPQQLLNQYSIDAMKEEALKETLSLIDTADDATARDSLSRRLELLSEPPVFQDITVRMGSLDRFVGEQIRVTHRKGIGPQGIGYRDRAMIILGKVTKKFHTVLECLDISRLLAMSFPPLQDVETMAPAEEWQGAWGSGTAYAMGDIVTHSGSTWLAIGYPTVGEEPGVGAAWEEIETTVVANGYFVLGDKTSPLPPPVGAYHLR